MIDERTWAAFASREHEPNISMDARLIIQGMSEQLQPIPTDKIVELLDEIDNMITQNVRSYSSARESRENITTIKQMLTKGEDKP